MFFFLSLTQKNLKKKHFLNSYACTTKSLIVTSDSTESKLLWNFYKLKFLFLGVTKYGPLFRS